MTEQKKILTKYLTNDLIGGSSRVTTDTPKQHQEKISGLRTKERDVEPSKCKILYIEEKGVHTTEKAPIELLPNVSHNMVQR